MYLDCIIMGARSAQAIFTEAPVTCCVRYVLSLLAHLLIGATYWRIRDYQPLAYAT